ncbi:ABC transporter substrate-binding protein [Pseudothermotoga thermarum]|uniref:Amino acid/amide ABC transporter substrate-binding protein, HAAT family n=1 Tax=Pseudothermotoga thermarum DSM 5069 TaxID=688269 RepID=F7YXT2_9THEM|nr:ABC transporter substrate-binding protein [Pseudothermotoga thermarum]AEH50726.1 amino acid/amide ABC transporter substrate-binding protein, HAAT family [Pseudothermotoga thermarum DSM 5069]
MKKACVLIFLAVVFVVLFAQEITEVRIGAGFEMTGPIAGYGQASWDGIKLAMKLRPTVNIGGKEIPVRVILMDNKGDKAESANVARRLIDVEKVSAIIGPCTSSCALAAGAIAEEKKVPLIGTTTTNPLVTQGKKFVFRACFIDPFQGAILAKFAWEHLKAKKVAIMVDVAQDYVVGLANEFMKVFKQLGGTYFVEYYTTGDQDFSAQLTNVLAKKPDVIFMPGYYAEIALMCVQARQLGFKGAFLAGDGADAPELIEIGGDFVEGLYYTTYFHPDADLSPKTKEFVEAYMKEYGRRADAFGALAFDAYNLILDAIERAQSTDPVKIRDAIAATKDFVGVAGTISFPPNSGDPIKPAVINTIKNRQFVLYTVIRP